MLVPICQDHFLRLANKSVCSACPSKLENEMVCRTLAAMFKDDNSAALEAIVTEIQSIRRTQSEVIDTIEQMQNQKTLVDKLSFTLFGVDGNNGLRGNVKQLLESVETLKRFVFIGIGIAIAANFIVPLFFK